MLPSGAVQRAHQLMTELLVEGMLRCQPFELTEQIGGLAEVQVGLEPRLERCQAPLIQPGPRSLGKRCVNVRQRRAAPEVERGPQTSRRLPGLAVRQCAP